MAVRLSKVIRELNVGVSTAVEFLQKKGFGTVEADSNAKITDEQYNALVNEFGKDEALRGKPVKPVAREWQKKVKEEKPVEKKVEEVIHLGVSEDLKPKFKTVGKIDLDKPAKKVTETAKKEEEPAPAPVKEERPVQEKKEESKELKPAAEEQKVEKQEKPQEAKPAKPAEAVTPVKKKETAPIIEEKKDEEGVFKLRTPEFVSKINVVGQIDLATLNQSTRPKKKSKEERKKEREEKDRQRQEQRKQLKDSIMKEIRKDGEGNAADGEGKKKKKRNRINKERVDIAKEGANNNSRQGGGNNKPAGGGFPGAASADKNDRKRKDRDRNKKQPVKVEVSEEDVAKQVKETLARLTAKGKNKGAKFRKEKRENAFNRQMELEMQEELESKVLKLTEFVTANELANMMDVPVTKVIGTCMSIGIMVSINQRLDAETIDMVAEEFGFQTEYVSAEVAEAITEEEDREEDLKPRAPIVTVMGHVDHGKTSLLDYIRKANVIAGEAGGITQHIGAYHVTLDDGRNITFLDTPGHEAFTAMRARGAKATDIAIIIVAADDSVMPQTKEAINHAMAAGVPIVFAINKVDKPAANPDKIKEELSAMNYLVEDWGGKYQSQEISAKKGMGVGDLLEKVLLEAEMLELKANPNRNAVGAVLESSLDKGRGYVATVLVQNGTLKVGDVILAGTHYGRVKAMFNERNQRVTEAGPSVPVLILGLNGAPTAGDTFNVLDSEQEAREIATKREQLQREQSARTTKMVTLEDIGRRRAIGNFQELNIIVKGDVDGSIEALSDSLLKLSTEEIQINVIHKAVGAISESDVDLAAASNAIIVGFQVRPSQAARKAAERAGVDIRLYSVIYQTIEEVKDAMAGMLAPELKEEVIGTAEVLQTYHISKVGTIAGAIVREGKIKRGCKIRLIRDGIVRYTGELGSLKRFKDDAKEVLAGYDCGLSIAGYNDLHEGDLIEGFEEVEVSRTI